MTLVLVVVLLSLVWLSGLGVTLFLFRSSDSIPRLLLCPFAGMSCAVLLFFFLLPLNLTGPRTAEADLALLGALAVAGIVKSPPRREEWRETWPVLVICSTAFLLAGWPLLVSGYHRYLGYGNPDVAYFIGVLRYFSDHVVQLGDPRFYRGIDPAGLLGLLVYAYQVPAVTGASVDELFSILCVAMVFLGPAGVFLLSRVGLGLKMKPALLISAVAATSSLAAYTFFLHSLGTLSVMATLPVAIAISMEYFRKPNVRLALLLVLLLGGSLYNYPQGAVIFVASCGAVGVFAIFRRGWPRRQLIFLGLAGAALVAVSLPYLKGVFLSLGSLSSGTRLDAGANEIQTGFALVLTERGLPFFWGLSNPYLGTPAWLGTPAGTFAIYFISAAILFLIVLAALLPRSRRTAALRPAIAAATLIIVYYFARDFGYGVFKLIAWVHFLFVVALGAWLIGAIRFRRRPMRSAFWAAPLALYVVGNVTLAVRLGGCSINSFHCSLSSVSNLGLEDFKSVETLAPHNAILVSLPDPVIRRWLTPFLGLSVFANVSNDKYEFIGNQDLSVEDSQPMSFLPDCDDSAHRALLDQIHLRCRDLSSTGILDWKGRHDLVEQSGPFTWSSRVFSLYRGIQPDTLVLGRGWYRPESLVNSRVAWQRGTFRWVRRRAEFFVLKPSPSPKRLRLSLVSGFGAASDRRHVDLMMNGRRLESIEVMGYRKMLTDPFVVPGPVSQMELSIEETAEPIARTLALWNKWVPGDSRRLNLAVVHLELLEGAENAPPSAVSFEDGLDQETVESNGILPDRWVGESASLSLSAPPQTTILEINGFIPSVATYSFPFRIEFFNGDELLGAGQVQAPGDFGLRIPVAGKVHGTTHITIRPCASFQPSRLGKGRDDRVLSFQLKSIRFLTR